MTTFSTNLLTKKPVFAVLSRIGDCFVSAFRAATVANSRIAQVEALQALTDEELAQKGLRREDIARYVFRDMFYV